MTTTHENERLVELVLGEVEAAEREEIEAHLAACPDCARRRAELAAAMGELPLALAPTAPPAALRSRLDASLDHLERFAPFAPRLGEVLGLSSNEARLALHVYERPERMRPTPRPGMRAEPIAAGAGGVTALLAYFDPGALVTHHVHDQEERIIVFQGRFVNDDGTVVRAGDELVSAVGTGHSNRVTDDEPCFCAIVKTARAAPA